jgi:hypothetical protein
MAKPRKSSNDGVDIPRLLQDEGALTPYNAPVINPIPSVPKGTGTARRESRKTDRQPNWGKWLSIPEVRIWEGVALSLNIDPDKVNHHPESWMVDDHLFKEPQEFKDRVVIARRNAGGGRALTLTTVQMGSVVNSYVVLKQFVSWAYSIGWELPERLLELNDVGVKTNATGDTLTSEEKKKLLACDAWSESELRDLLCGLPPNRGRPSTADTNEAHEAIRRAVLLRELKANPISDATRADEFYAHHRFYTPPEAIRWATLKPGRFPKFPFTRQDVELSEVASPKSNWPWGSFDTDLLRLLAEAATKFWKLYDPSDPSTAPTKKDVCSWLTSQGVAARTAEVMATILRANGLPPGPRK